MDGVHGKEGGANEVSFTEDSLRYWAHPGILGQVKGAYPLQHLSALLCNGHKNGYLIRRWSNQHGSWEYALTREELGQYVFKSGRCSESLVAKLERATIADFQEQSGLAVDGAEPWHWITVKTVGKLKGAHHHLRIHRNLAYAEKQGTVIAYERNGAQEYLVREQDIPALVFAVPSAFSAQVLEEVTGKEKVYPLDVQMITDDAQARKWYGRTLWCDWKTGEIERTEIDGRKVYFVTAAQREAYAKRVYGSVRTAQEGSGGSLEDKIAGSIECKEGIARQKENTIGVTTAMVMQATGISYNGASNRLVKAAREFEGITKTGKGSKGVTYWMSREQYEYVCGERKRGKPAVERSSAEGNSARSGDTQREQIKKHKTGPAQEVLDGHRDGYEPFTIEDKKTSWEQISEYTLQAGKVERLTQRDEFMIGEQMDSARQSMYEVLFRSEVGLSLLVEELTEVLQTKNRVKGYVDRDELAVDGGYDGCVPVTKLVAANLNQIQEGLQAQTADVLERNRANGRDAQRTIEERISARTESLYEQVENLHVKKWVVGLLAYRAEKRAELARELCEDRTAGTWSAEERYLRETVGLGERLKAALAEYSRARDRLVAANRPLTLRVAKRYWGRGLPVIDLIMEGTVGLIGAADYFDHRLGYKFSTIATKMIEQKVERALFRKTSLVRSNRETELQAGELNRARQALTTLFARPPTEEELCAELEIDRKKLMTLIPLSRNPVSIDRAYEDNERSSILHRIADEHQRSPDEEFAQAEMRAVVNRALHGLPFRESGIMHLRYGLNGWPLEADEVARAMGVREETVCALDSRIKQEIGSCPRPDDIYSLFSKMSEPERSIARLRYGLGGEELSLEQVGKVFGVTRERVRQIERRARSSLERQRSILEQLIA